MHGNGITCKKPITIMAKTTNTTNTTNNVTIQSHKSKNTGYNIVYKNKTDKSEKSVKNLKTCTDYKTWIKTQSRANMEYLHIYDKNDKPVRLSAWIN